jgi:predicted Ser/Thr protein kinase
MRLIGQTFGKYRISEHLGSGGMSEVYKAYQPGLDRYVAIKVLHSFLAQEEDFLTRFQREAKFAAMLRHPNIIQIYDFDLDKETNSYYMVMEYVDGPSLKTRLQKMAKKGQMMSLEESIRIVTAIANALDYAHQRGMVHRDIKPANIMFNKDGEPILTDFGIAKMVDVAGLTASGAMVGTPAYMAPEQGMGQAGDERSDIYSLGVVLYQLTTGHRPFDADTPLGVALKHINAPLPPPVVVNPDLPKSIEAVTLKALAKDPDKRYQTAKEFAIALKKAAAGELIEPPAPGMVAAELTLDAQGPIPADDSEWDMATLPSAPAAHLPPTPPPPASIAAAQPKQRRVGAIVAIAAGILLIAGIVALLATGTAQRLLASIGQPQTTSTAEGVPTPNLVSTEVAAQLATRDAISTLEATINATLTPVPTETPTPMPSLTPDVDATSTAECSFEMEVIADPPIEQAILMPDEVFTKRWIIKNVGSCPWPADTRLAFSAGDELEVVETIERPNVGLLAPDKEAEIRLSLRAPTDFDTYNSQWELQYAGGSAIGETLTIAFEVGPTPTPRPTATPQSTPTPYVNVWMSEPPTLALCDKKQAQGRITWGFGGGPSDEYRFFYGSVSPDTELAESSREFEFGGGVHVETYYTTSGPLTFPVPAECGEGDFGRCGGPEFGYEIVWQKVYYKSADCAGKPTFEQPDR